MEGSIETWNQSGFGIIRGSDKKTYLARYSDFVAYMRTGKKIALDIGQDVSFLPVTSNGKSKAENIEYDERKALFRFAYFPDYEGSIAKLANEIIGDREKWSSSSFDRDELNKSLHKQAQEHDWLGREKEIQIRKFGQADDQKAKLWVEKHISKIIAKQEYDVLFSFLERTFERLQFEKKIVYSETGAAFNTCLGNKFDKDIYAIFRTSTNPATPYVFDKFSDKNFVVRNFATIPEPPNYFIDITTNSRVPSDHLLLDFELEIVPDELHLFDERRSRFPEIWQDLTDEECSSKFEQLLERTRNRVRRNFRAAVPFYYPALKKIQMLLPVTFPIGEDKSETRALVISREGAGYSAETIMPLEWAYKNARLLAKPDREDWLDF